MLLGELQSDNYVAMHPTFVVGSGSL